MKTTIILLITILLFSCNEPKEVIEPNRVDTVYIVQKKLPKDTVTYDTLKMALRDAIPYKTVFSMVYIDTTIFIKNTRPLKRELLIKRNWKSDSIETPLVRLSVATSYTLTFFYKKDSFVFRNNYLMVFKSVKIKRRK